jgi:cell division septation protein DedD
LAQIAMGNSGAALAALDALAATSPAADVGLAYALAGQPQRAISMLEPAARTEGADARVRQNLALSYALAGDWQKARVTALQDVSPADIDARMEQWAAFTSPQTSYDQVASLLGVTPVQDAGRPSQLALAPTIAEPVALAAVEAPVPVVETPVAEVQPVVEPEEVQVQYAAAAEQLVTPQPAVLSVAPQPAEAPLPAFEPRKKKPRVAGQSPKRSIASASGRFVVQIGAYANANQVEKAWSQAQRRYRFDDSSQPLSTTVTIPGRGMFHRLSIAGFDDRGDASQLCASIRARGGACFVRATAGDAPVRWASRNSRRA